tara:strand:+ start:85 stop:276 length:192 start_codon:yes stop_codon:yes gene_type:complete
MDSGNINQALRLQELVGEELKTVVQATAADVVMQGLDRFQAVAEAVVCLILQVVIVEHQVLEA